MSARIVVFRFCLLLLAAMVLTARIGARQPAKNEPSGPTLDEAEIRKLVDQLGVEQFRLREDATKRVVRTLRDRGCLKRDWREQ